VQRQRKPGDPAGVCGHVSSCICLVWFRDAAAASTAWTAGCAAGSASLAILQVCLGVLTRVCAWYVVVVQQQQHQQGLHALLTVHRQCKPGDPMRHCTSYSWSCQLHCRSRCRIHTCNA
jgi:hypothetical protein